MNAMNKKQISKIGTMIIFAMLTLVVLFAMPESGHKVYADPSAQVESTNPWGTGGQIVLNLSGCQGYETITVVVEFDGTVNSASGWGFDSYTVSGNQVTATCSASGPNSWGFDGNVGIQVEGNNISVASLISISGSGTHQGSNANGGGNNGGNNGGDNGGNNGGNNGGQAGQGGALMEPNPDAVAGDDWLTTDGNRIVDMNGTEVWLTGVNWFGYNTGTNIFDGCWSCNMASSLEAIADHGFNLLRIPISAQLLNQWANGEYPNANFNQATNAELVGMNSLEIFDYAIQVCENVGLKVMIDIHSANTDASGHNAPLWYTDQVSTDDYLAALDFISDRYADNDTVVAYDLKNEPHGPANETHAIWNDSSDDNNWRYVAELAGNVVLDNNPNALIVIEGIQIYPIDIENNNFTSTNPADYHNAWWGGNLMGVADFPIDFGSEERNRQIVYSPHDYGPAVYQQPWFYSGFSYESMMEDYWYDYWFFIHDQDIAPILIGEWGGFMSGDNLTWMTYLRQLIGEYNLHFTFWCFNANSGDTGGLVLDDFTTWDEEKYSFVSEVLWTDEDGSFIGLDHAIPLGSNGISLSEFSGMEVTPIEPDASTSDDSEPTTESTIEAEAEAQEESEASSNVASEENDKTEISEEDTKSSISKIIKIIVISVVSVAVLILIGAVAYNLGRGKDD